MNIVKLIVIIIDIFLGFISAKELDTKDADAEFHNSTAIIVMAVHLVNALCILL